MKALRTGITTGVCAAAATRAAAEMLRTGRPAERVEVVLSDGTPLSVPVLRCALDAPGQATAAVRKDAGDDVDATDGLEVVATVGLDGPPPAGASAILDDGVRLIAGEGVGVVSLPGLQAAVGEPAINPVPRRMIVSALGDLAGRACWVRLAVPGGREAAKKTFNPRLGVLDGISILGTTGIVRPYSSQAVRDTIRCAMAVAAACGIRRPVLCPGNIGARAAGRHLDLRPQQLIEVSNEWGCAVDELAGRGFEAVLLLGHPGKLGKLAAGEWDTHSSRSAPAAEWVARLAQDVLGGPVPPAQTAEGLFAGLSPPDRRRLADQLAARVAQAARERMRGTGILPVCPTAVPAVEMDGRGTGILPVCSTAVPAVETEEQQRPMGGTPMGRTGETPVPRVPDVAVMLIDMQGNELGTSGKVDAWRPARSE